MASRATSAVAIQLIVSAQAPPDRAAVGLRVSMVECMLARVPVWIALSPNIRARRWKALQKSCSGGVRAAAHFMLLNRVCAVWRL